ncbi:hypothetical protein AK812_SmicGene23929 [Symbiodinium microadriaticum]|uniref:Uncharacterized protein n=1 Tax=Symbiodinium microadriaticum TaxID=2951 RepID=A0A1Q9DG20_SYMMI|nr:hypothetical protein AK812_SmicGene23929 [Symbiodinium microadriaticum]
MFCCQLVQKFTGTSSRDKSHALADNTSAHSLSTDQVEVVQLMQGSELDESGPEALNAKNRQGQTALHLSAMAGSSRSASLRLLVIQGASVDIKLSHGMSYERNLAVKVLSLSIPKRPAYYAEQRGETEAVRFIDQGAVYAEAPLNGFDQLDRQLPMETNQDSVEVWADGCRLWEPTVQIPEAELLVLAFHSSDMKRRYPAVLSPPSPIQSGEALGRVADYAWEAWKGDFNVILGGGGPAVIPDILSPAARADHANPTSSSVAAAHTLLRRAGAPVALSGTRATGGGSAQSSKQARKVTALIRRTFSGPCWPRVPLPPMQSCFASWNVLAKNFGCDVPEVHQQACAVCSIVCRIARAQTKGALKGALNPELVEGVIGPIQAHILYGMAPPPKRPKTFEQQLMYGLELVEGPQTSQA